MSGDGEKVEFLQSGSGEPTLRTVVSKEKDIACFEDFGVSFDGSKDDYEAVLNCINYARERKLFIHLPGQGGYLRVWKWEKP